MIGVLLMIKRFIKLYISDLGLQFTNRSLIIKFQTLYVDQRRQSMFDKLLQSTRVNDKCSTKFTYAGYIRFVLLTYFGWTSLEGYYKISMLARFICLLLTRYQLNKLVYLVIHRGTTPAWWFWFLLVNTCRAMAWHFYAQQHLGVIFGAWYWHFVDVVWLALYFVVYVWGNK